MSSAVTLQLEMMRLAVTRHACRLDTMLVRMQPGPRV